MLPLVEPQQRKSRFRSAFLQVMKYTPMKTGASMDRGFVMGSRLRTSSCMQVPCPEEQFSPQAPWRNNNISFLSREAAVTEQGETIIGFYLLALGWLSWFGNSIVIFVLYKQRHLLQPTDYLTFNLAVSDASISVFGYSRGIIEIFNVFRDDGFIITSIWTCQVDGFLTLLFGLASINTLTVISVTRYIKGCHPERGCFARVCTQQASWTALDGARNIQSAHLASSFCSTAQPAIPTYLSGLPSVDSFTLWEMKITPTIPRIDHDLTLPRWSLSPRSAKRHQHSLAPMLFV